MPDVRLLTILSMIHARLLVTMTPAPNVGTQALADPAAAVTTLVEVALLIHSPMAQHHRLSLPVTEAIARFSRMWIKVSSVPLLKVELLMMN